MTAPRNLRRTVLAAAVLQALASAAVAADYNWSAGNLFVSGVPNPLLSPDTMTIGGGGTKFVDGSTFSISAGAKVSWITSDTIYMQNGGAIANAGLWQSTADNLLYNNGGTTPQFSNTGTFAKTGGLGNTTVGTIAFVNSGTIAAESGKILFNGGNVTFNVGSIFTGAGQTVVGNNASFNGAFSSSNLVLQSGTYMGSSAVLGGVSPGSVSFTGGNLAGSWQIAANQTLNANGGGTKIFDALALDNQGTLNWNTNDTVYLQNGTVVDNHGNFNVNQSTQLYNNGGTLPVFNNYGTLKVASGQALAVGTLQFVNKGTGIIDAAGTVNFNGGNATFNSGTTFTGAGTVNINNNATFAGNYTGSNIFISGGTSTGDGAVIHGNTAFTGGTLTGTWTVAGGQQLALRGGGTKYGSGLQITNGGTLAVQTSDPLYVQNGTNITNASTGVIDFQTDSLWYNNGGATSSIVNLGLIQKSGGVGTSTIGNGLALSNLGVVDVRTGTIQLPNNFTNDGTLKGIGAYTTNLLTNNGHVAPGESPGTLTLNGNFAQTAGGFFDVGLDGASFGQLLVNGSANLAGSIDAICLGACSYAVGTTWDVMHATTGVAGTFAGPVLMTGFSSGAFTVTYTANDVWLTVTEATVAAVPEPGTYALMLSGLAAVGCLARRRRA